jgi:DNA helicase-2/ATP-dependent DNA helicase PcrA
MHSRVIVKKLVDSEPSRFIEEIKEEYIEYINLLDSGGYRYKPTTDTYFGDVDKSKLRLAEPIVKIHQKEIQANQFLQQISVNQKTS